MAGDSVAGEQVVTEDPVVCFEIRRERVTLIGSADMVVRQAESSKGC